MSEPTPEFVLYDTPEQGMALVLLNGASGYKIGGAPELYGQQTEVARYPTDERTRREVRERLADPDPEPDDREGLVEWCEAKAQEAEDAMKDHSEGTVVAIEQSARAETFRALRDRLREADDGE